MTGRIEADQQISQPTDCPETGMLVMLTGAKLGIDHSQVYTETARQMGIFEGNVVDARVSALGQKLTELTARMQDRLTAEGRKHYKQNYPKETRKLMAKIMLSHAAEYAG